MPAICRGERKFIMTHTITAVKSVRQPFQPSFEILHLMDTFRIMVNDCVSIGLENNVSSMKKLCSLAYKRLARYDILSYYKLCAISHAAGMLANREKSIRRKMQPREPYAKRPLLVSCYGFRIVDGSLRIPTGSGIYCSIPLNRHVMQILSVPLLRIHSFTLTPESACICYSREVEEIECKGVYGIDRDLSNLTIGNFHQIEQYDLTKAVEISKNTRSVMSSLRRNDVRIRRKLYQKYGVRRNRRVNQLLHRVSKAVVRRAKQNKSAIAFEDIRYIRKLYRKGSYQGRLYRSRLNDWSFAEVKRQIEYKAAWEGLPIIQLSVKETRGTSQLCPRCGKRIAQVDRKTRQLWCDLCKRWMDRDVVAAMNLSIKGLQRFCSSQGLAGEAMVQESGSEEPAILRVDASKLSRYPSWVPA